MQYNPVESQKVMSEIWKFDGSHMSQGVCPHSKQGIMCVCVTEQPAVPGSSML